MLTRATAALSAWPAPGSLKTDTSPPRCTGALQRPGSRTWCDAGLMLQPSSNWRSPAMSSCARPMTIG
eukprot:3065987-Lingulodinium_polyedra.AAC.1